MRRSNQNIFDDEQSVDRWLISYADFITLLFAFFVVMYSVSQVNESKYKILSDSLFQAFETRQTSIIPIPLGDEPARGIIRELDEESTDGVIVDEISNSGLSENFASTEEFKELENGLRESLGDLIEQELADINSDVNWININLRSGLLFQSGEAQLNEGADPLLEEVASHLNKNRQLILVHGHTDNIPIQTELYPSNWELSSARAVAVVRKLQSSSVEPPRMSVEGHGEYQPIASNDTPEGRAKNRRVVVSISRKQALPIESVATETEAAIISETVEKDIEPEFEIVRLPGGGVIIRGKELPPENSTDDDVEND